MQQLKKFSRCCRRRRRRRCRRRRRSQRHRRRCREAAVNFDTEIYSGVTWSSWLSCELTHQIHSSGTTKVQDVD